MRKPARRRAAAAAWLVAGCLPIVSVYACSSTASLVGQGGTCELASDCVEGLICIPTSNGRICSNDLSSVQKTEVPPAAADASSDAADADARATFASDAPTDDDAPVTVTPPMDATTPPPPQDSAPPPVDSAPPKDSAPPVDSAPPPVDSATDSPSD